MHFDVFLSAFSNSTSTRRSEAKDTQYLQETTKKCVLCMVSLVFNGLLEMATSNYAMVRCRYGTVIRQVRRSSLPLLFYISCTTFPMTLEKKRRQLSLSLSLRTLSSSSSPQGRRMLKNQCVWKKPLQLETWIMKNLMAGHQRRTVKDRRYFVAVR